MNIITISFIFSVKDCGSVPSVAESTHNKTGTTVNQSVTYTCDTGYEIASGNVTLICLDTGAWDIINTPICARK